MQIRNVFNANIRLKYYPKIWKVAEIIAIPKPGIDASQVFSYRPISILPVLSKIIEKLIYLDQANIIPDHHYSITTIQQIHWVAYKISQDLDEKKFCIGLYFDVEKAFDNVWLKSLLYKLKQILPVCIF